MPRPEPIANSYLDKISALGFIRKYELAHFHQSNGTDSLLILFTPRGKFTFLVEQKRSYFDRSSLNAFISQAQQLTRVHRKPLLLLTRYLPEPSAERLISTGINFIDQ